MAKDKVSVVTPIGIAKYPKVNKPDDPKFGGDFKCKLILDPSKPQVVALMKTCIEVLESAYAPGKIKDRKTGKLLPDVRLPFKKVVDEEQNVTIEFEARSKYKPLLTDSKGAPVPESVVLGGGSKVRLSATLLPFSDQSKYSGVKAYLDCVQIASLVEYKGRDVVADMGAIDDDEMDGGGYVTSSADVVEGDEQDSLEDAVEEAEAAINSNVDPLDF